MILVASSPGYTQGGTISTKMVGVAMASLSSGIGELSFLSLTHFYGPWSLAAWSNGTGAAGLCGAGLYSLLTTALGLHTTTALMTSASLPAVMVVAFFGILPSSVPTRDTRKLKLQRGGTSTNRENRMEEAAGLLDTSPPEVPILADRPPTPSAPSFRTRIRRVRGLFLPLLVFSCLCRGSLIDLYSSMLPLFCVYLSEYTINLSLFPTLLFPLGKTPFASFSTFYPTYSLLYQVGVFVSRSSLPFIRIPPAWLYPLALLQACNFFILLLQALYDSIGGITGETTALYVVFAIVIWEGLLGGSVYVSTFDGIRTKYLGEEREWCLGATTVSDSAGVAVAGVLASVVEKAVCGYQVSHGQDWCTKM